MAIPNWADAEFSTRIPKIRSCGEGQVAEFKAEFPQQVHSLCEEIAAFASSGGGEILIGVHDNGEVAGFDADTAQKRDDVLHRTQSLIANVKPVVTYQLHLGYDGGCILGISISSKQSEPVYYYNFRPYVRDGRTSRPATPDEVKDLVWAHPSSEIRRKHQELQFKIVADHHEEMRKIHAQQNELSTNTMKLFLDGIK